MSGVRSCQMKNENQTCTYGSLNRFCICNTGRNSALSGTATSTSSRESEPSSGLDHSSDYRLPFPVYYINLNQSVDRRRRMEKNFGAIWDLRRVSAIDGQDASACTQHLGERAYRRLGKHLRAPEDSPVGNISSTPSFVFFMAQGDLGAILSHLLAIRRAYLEGNEIVMIVEDDLSPILMYVLERSHREQKRYVYRSFLL